MYWQETKENQRYTVPDDIVDVVYSIDCRALPVDHAYALSQAIQRALPWFAEEESVGLHTIHVADSGNGWMRPDDPDALLHLSRRTKLTLRLPKHRIEDAGKLMGQTLDIQRQAPAGGKVGCQAAQHDYHAFFALHRDARRYG